MGVRDEARAQTRARILEAARAQIAEHGAGFSMRAVAREVGLVSSAVYRYYPTREALLTAMIVESYGRLASALADADAPDSAPRDRWRALGVAFRSWALTHPHEFQLVYGTPIPGYVAPPETVPAAAAVIEPFVSACATGDVGRFGNRLLRDQFGVPAAEFGAEPVLLAGVVAELAALVGFIGLELAGHFVGTADPAGPLFDALLERQCATLGLTGSSAREAGA